MIKDLRKKSDTELAELIFRLKSQLLGIRFKLANGETEGADKKREIKRTIAIAMTVLSERKTKVSFTAYDARLIKVENGQQVFIPVDLSKNSYASEKPAESKTKKFSIGKTENTKTESAKFDQVDLKNLQENQKAKKVDNVKKVVSSVRKISSKG